MTPVTSSAATPTEALTRQLSGPPRARKRRMSRLFVSALGNPTKRWIAQAPSSACSVAPAAIAAGAATARSSSRPPRPAKVSEMLTRNDPSVTPGHTRRPATSSAISAAPAAGQTELAKPGGMASSSDSRPSTK